MSAEQPDLTGPEADAPAALAEALRRLDARTILVTPQMDQLVLERPRLHLARVRQLRGHLEHPESQPQDLALAAHAPLSLGAKPADYRPNPAPDSERAYRKRWWQPVLPGCGAAFAIAAIVSLVAPGSAFTRAIASLFNFVGIQPTLPLLLLSVACFAAWLAARSK